MKRFVASLVLPAFLLACGSGSNPFDQGLSGVAPGLPPAPPAGPPAGIPASISNDLTQVTFDSATNTLVVDSLTLDNVPLRAVYARRPNLDTNGYLAFTAQNDGLDRHSTAYFGRSNNDQSVRAGVAATGGPRNRFFSGAFYERDGLYTPPPVTPTSGLVSYSGNYVGLINIGFIDRGGARDDLIAPPGGTTIELTPDQAMTVQGNVFINADFADNQIEGNITNRTVVDNTPGLPAGTVLPSLVLISTDINADGSFAGTVEYDAIIVGNEALNNPIGDFGGILGGPNASGLAGAIALNEFDGINDPLGLEGEREFGIFVLDQCGQPVEDTLGCQGTNP